MENLWIAFGLALGLASASAPAQEGNGVLPLRPAPAGQATLKAGVDRRDRSFIVKAARAGHAELAAGKLAVTRGSSEEVKAFGRRMVEHHAKANTELEEIAIKKGVTWPTAPDAGQQRELKRLRSLTGADFDRRYMEESGVDDHEDTVKLFRKAQKDVTDPELKAFFERNMPAVEKHFEMARSIERSLKDERRTAGGQGSASAGSSRP